MLKILYKDYCKTLLWFEFEKLKKNQTKTTKVKLGNTLIRNQFLQQQYLYKMQKYLKQGKYSYNEEDLLGEGSFGKVYKGTNNYSNQEVALKQIELSKLEKGEEMLKTILLSQITVMRKFNKKMQQDPCPFLVRQEDVFRTDKHIFIVMEICCGGTLQDQIRGKRFKQKECIEVLYCICKGLEYMAEMSIVHRDLKPENIFISSVKVGKGDGKQTKIYKIGDFGFAAQKQEFEIAMGTFPYMAPEMFKKQKYNNKVDVWSLGVIAYQILFGGLYFVGNDRFQIQKNIKQKPFILSQKEKSKASGNYQDFMIRCLNKDPKYRIQVEKLLSHPLFYEIEKQLSEAKAAIYRQQKAGEIQMKKQISEQSKFSDQVFEEVIKPKQQTTGKHQQKIDIQKKKNEQIVQTIGVKAAAFSKLYHLLEQITKMRIMAEKFHEIQQKKRRCTEFIQIYLLKDACAIINRLIYTIVNKQNYIQFQQHEFQELLLQENVNFFAEFSQKCLKEYNWVTGLYNQKYKWFMNDFIKKYDAEEQELIRKIVNEDIYELVNPQIFQKQLKKWKFVLDEDYETKANRFQQWHPLSAECQRILQMKLNG